MKKMTAAAFFVVLTGQFYERASFAFLSDIYVVKRAVILVRIFYKAALNGTLYSKDGEKETSTQKMRANRNE